MEQTDHHSLAPIDCVYTWVDDKFEGYQEQIRRYSKSNFDQDPSRTRDNLEILRFSLRSLEQNAPWLRNVYLLTCRPQIPAWLNTSHPRLKIIHHDEIILAKHLPTFNSFAIVSHLHLLPNLSEQFLYIEDDMLLLKSTTLNDFQTSAGLLKVYEHKSKAPEWKDIPNRLTERPWNMALAESNRLLNLRFSERRRSQSNHVPLFIKKNEWLRMVEIFDDAIEQTRASKFRSEGNIAPEFLYPNMVLEEGKAKLISAKESQTHRGYVPLENLWPVTLWFLLRVKCKHPKWVTLNDNFGKRPSLIAEFMVRKSLQSWFPRASSFEISTR